MDGAALKSLRTRAGRSQQDTAKLLQVTQAYLSMLERGKRSLSEELVVKASYVFGFPALSFPLRNPSESKWTTDRFREQLGSLGYSGFAHLQKNSDSNPAELLMAALDSEDLDQRVTEALPWVPFAYPTLNWDWLLSHAKLADRQNRLAYVVSLATEVATKNRLHDLEMTLRLKLASFEHSRLAVEDTLCKGLMTRSERAWLRTHRSKVAEHWNLLTDLTVEQMSHVYH